jgi:YVTN family beta-propeller protein
MRTLAYLLSLLVVAAIPSEMLLAKTTPDTPLSPTDIIATKDGKTLYIACATGERVLQFDTVKRQVSAEFPVPAKPTGLCLLPDERLLVVTCAAPESIICLLNPASGRIIARLKAGHTATAPVLSPDGHFLYVCNRFNHDVSVFDLAARKELRRITVQREPVAAALTHDGKFLLVANLLHNGRADATNVAAVVSVVDVVNSCVAKELRLPNGSGSLNDIRISPDGRYAVVTHILSRFSMPATQLDRGWMNTNAKTIIDLGRMEVLNTVLLDNVDRGMANPWGIAWSADGTALFIAHAGTHEISIINFPALLDRLRLVSALTNKAMPSDGYLASRCREDVPNDLAFLVGLRQQIPLPTTDRGPRAIAVAGSMLYVANYFSDTVSVLDPKAPEAAVTSVPLGPSRATTTIRKGEFYFHDATICFQGWQSCASCHPGDGRVDALNWDLLNDGVGNPKNNKSLLLTHRTPPAMSLGVRETAETAVRAGIRHILFTVQPPEVADSIDEYLKSLQPVPSPFLVGGKLSQAAQRGKKIFNRAGCVDCHPPGLFTNLKAHDVGTCGPFDQPGDQFDTPSLVEIWRTAPYLHDGSAATPREVVTTRNPSDRHGKTSNLSRPEIDDLCAYLLSL